MFGGNVYIVKSPDLLYSLQRQPKSLSFWKFEAEFSAKLGGMPKSTADKLFAGLSPKEFNEANYIVDGLKHTKAALSSHDGMDEMLQVVATVTNTDLGKLHADGRQTVDLFAWVQHEITMATTEAVYGPANPYRDPAVEHGFW